MDYNDYLINTLYYISQNEEILKLLSDTSKNKSSMFLELFFGPDDSNINVKLFQKENFRDFTKRLPKYTRIKSNENSESCSICLETYQEKTYKRQLDCSHNFHKKCIDKWLKKCISEENLHCPICRKQYEMSVKEITNFNIPNISIN
jgi:hypothetical protein